MFSKGTVSGRAPRTAILRRRFTEEAYHRLPGTSDAERTSAVARRLTGLIATQGLMDGFFLKVDADDSGVQIVDTSR
jgi:hypothetical protein